LPKIRQKAHAGVVDQKHTIRTKRMPRQLPPAAVAVQPPLLFEIEPTALCGYSKTSAGQVGEADDSQQNSSWARKSRGDGEGVSASEPESTDLHPRLGCGRDQHLHHTAIQGGASENASNQSHLPPHRLQKDLAVAVKVCALVNATLPNSQKQPSDSGRQLALATDSHAEGERCTNQTRNPDEQLKYDERIRTRKKKKDEERRRRRRKKLRRDFRTPFP
jgi:hypothetical protein